MAACKIKGCKSLNANPLTKLCYYHLIWGEEE